MSANGKNKLTCQKCGNSWWTKSTKLLVSCTSCGNKVRNSPNIEIIKEESLQEVSDLSEINFCKYCGTKRDEDAVFCKKCGKMIS